MKIFIFYSALFIVFIFGVFLVDFTTSKVQAQSSPVGYAIVDYRNVHISLDNGATWIRKDVPGSGKLTSITSSSDGQRLAVVRWPGYIYTSSNGGDSWTQRIYDNNWRDITSSSDGQYLAAIASGYYIYTSLDYGVNWTPRESAGIHDWNSITSSYDPLTNDGQRLAVTSRAGYIYTSLDYGVNWTPRESAGSHDWNDITSSSNGQYLVAAQSGYIHTSLDYGVNWTPRESAGSYNWRSITSSSDGQYLAVAQLSGYIYTSSDGGANWIKRESAGTHDWNGITSSSDGQKILALSSDEVSHEVTFIAHTSSNGGINWDESAPFYIGRGTAAREISITSFSVAPVADPYNLIVSKTCATNVTLRWRAIPGATSYTVTRQTGSVSSSFDATGATYNPTTQTWTYVDVAAAANTLYTYTVKANNSAPSDPPRAISTSPDFCKPILNVATICEPQEELQQASAIIANWFLAIFRGASSQYNKLSWIAPMDATGLQGYNIYRDGTVPGNKITTTGLITTYDDTSANVTNSFHNYVVKSVYQTTGEVGLSNTAYSTICPIAENPPLPPGLTKQVQLWFDPTVHRRTKPATDNEMNNQPPLIITREGQNVKVDYSWMPSNLLCRGVVDSSPSGWITTANTMAWLAPKDLSTGSFTFTGFEKGTYIVKLNCIVPPVAKNNSSGLANIWHTITGIAQSSSVNSNPITFTFLRFTFQEF